MNADACRNTRPATPDGLWNWVHAFTGVSIARERVCRAHQPPWEAFRTWVFSDPLMSLMLGPRGGGKSFLTAIRTHLRSRFNPGHAARILGGSKAQSLQIYEALRKTVWEGGGPLGGDHDTVKALLEERAKYHNGSDIRILAASSRSVRGSHVPLLLLDEVDEIDPDIRESAMGMCMAQRGVPASVGLTSTWHRVGGPMAELIDRGRKGEFPFHTFCIFEVLERCPEERSGSQLEKCPECPLFRWCHSDRQDDPARPPKAKLSDGHYAIDALIQKVVGTSRRIFEADYLCAGPKADGVWFPAFDRARHVTEAAEYRPGLPVHLALDSGVHSGAVYFQVIEIPGVVPRTKVNVFADYYSFNKTAYQSALDVLEIARVRCNGVMDRRCTDPAGAAATAIGPTVIGEYERAGLRHLDRWPKGPVADGLALIESLVEAADGSTGLAIHPRCEDLIGAFETYRRKQRQNQWVDEPEDPQHPAEDMMDALRGGLRHHFPAGNRPPVPYHRTVPRNWIT